MLPSEYIQEGWRQGAEARDIDGNPCEPNDGNARSWCSTAAISLWPDEPQALEILVEMAFLLTDDDRILDQETAEHLIAEWNDAPERTKEAVVATLQEIEGGVGVTAAAMAL